MKIYNTTTEFCKIYNKSKLNNMTTSKKYRCISIGIQSLFFFLRCGFFAATVYANIFPNACNGVSMYKLNNACAIAL